jgi:DNA-binding transcriptional LysR family regulator
MHIEIRHARVVVTLAEVGSISKAAAKLDLPQPSVSAQLRRIEKTLGGPLFVRSSAGVIPTPFGERLIPLLVELAGQAEAVIAEAAASPAGTLKIGIADWPHVSLTMAIQDAVPRMKIQTVTLDPAAGLEAIGSGALSAALVPTVETLHSPFASDTALSAEVIVREPIYLALPHDHIYAGESTLNSVQLASLAWVRHVHGHRFHPVEEYVFNGMDTTAKPDVLHEVAGQAEAMNWVRDAGAAALATPTGPIRDVSLVAIRDIPHSKLDLVWRKGLLDPSTVRHLLTAVRAHYRSLARRVPRYRSWMAKNVEAFPELQPLLS